MFSVDKAAPAKYKNKYPNLDSNEKNLRPYSVFIISPKSNTLSNQDREIKTRISTVFFICQTEPYLPSIWEKQSINKDSQMFNVPATAVPGGELGEYILHRGCCYAGVFVWWFLKDAFCVPLNLKPLNAGARRLARTNTGLMHFKRKCDQ